MPNADPDVIASHLADLAAVGRAMPPAWDGARISIPACGPDGVFGRVLPGRGLYLDMDRRVLGITRRSIPHVFERSPVQRLVDVLCDERGAIASIDDILAARATGRAQDVWVRRAGPVDASRVYSSTFQASGGTYTGIPSGAAHTRATPGAWSTGLTNPTKPNKKYLLSLGLSVSYGNWHFILVDLLIGAGNVNTNSGGSTLATVPLPRYPTGAGVMAILDVTTALGGTPSNVTLFYTNQSGALGQSQGNAMTTSCITSRLQPSTGIGPFFPLGGGDYGVRSVYSIGFSAAMGAGLAALNLYFPLAFLPVSNSQRHHLERDATKLVDGLTELVTDVGGVLGCLVGYFMADGHGPGDIGLELRTVEG